MKTLRTILLLCIVLTSTGTSFAQDLISSSSNSKNKFTYRSGNPLQSFEVESRGKIDLTDDDKDVKRLSPDGYLEIQKTVFGSTRRILITPEGPGLKREYFEGRSSQPFDPEGKRWLAEVLPELVKTTTIGAEGRVNRFYRRGGIPSVLSEINSMKSSYVIAAYADLLIKLQPVTAKDYALIISGVVDAMDSDHYRTEFLENNMDRFANNQQAMEAVCAASTRMESDHYKTQVIKRALKNQSISAEAMKSILEASGKMESDHYLTEVVTTLLEQAVTDATISQAIATSKSIESDHYRSVVLRTALEKPNLSATSYKLAIESVRNIESDHYKTEVLTELLKNKLPADQIVELVDLSQFIDSDHYLTEIFTDVMATQTLSDESFKKLMTRIATVDSDHYASAILRSALNQPSLNDAKLISVLTAAASMGSDHYITEVLKAAAPKVKSGSNALKDAYRTTAKTINSETYYGRALRAIE